MQGKPTSFWAKLEQDKDDNGKIIGWHPLEAHCADVAACCEALLTRTLLGKRLARLGGLGALDEVQISRLCVLAALHDIGKVNHGFQARSDEKAPLVGHVREAIALMKQGGDLTERLVESLDYKKMSGWAEDPDDITSLLRASISHHGRPQIAKRLERHMWKASGQKDPLQEIEALRTATQRWFPNAWQDGIKPLPRQPAFHHAFSGLVMLADWIGSDSDRFFGFAEKWHNHGYMDLARQSAATALQKLGIDNTQARNSMAKGPARFSDVSRDKPRPLQQAVLELPVSTGGSIAVLEAETGAGKTEAALLRFVALYKAGEVDGLYFALPTRTAATQIYQRVFEAAKLAFPNEETRPPVVMAVPGYLRVDDKTGQHLPHFKVLWNDDEDKRFAYRAWAAENSKRYLAGCIVVGTVDQVLLSTLAVDHSHLRATALLRHLLIVDEVHASDGYMTILLREVLNRHVGAGGHAFLMSATLGAEARQGLLDPSPGRKPPLTLQDCQSLAYPYPVIWSRESQGQVEHIAIVGDQRSKTVVTELLPAMGEPEQVAAKALDAAADGAKVLVLRNTVKSCLQTQLALEQLAEKHGEQTALHSCNDRVAPHHSRYAREDRKLLDQELETHFGKKRPAGGRGRVAVATQTVQQSLDLDADLMITDLCPMDVLLQRIGRLHRHQRERPEGFAQARCLILCPAERDLSTFISEKTGEARGPNGLGKVYEDLRIIEATWRILENYVTLQIPQDNRSLVESAVHHEALEAVVDQGVDRWKKHQIQVAGSTMAGKQTAHFNLANWRVSFNDVDQGLLFPDRGEQKIGTRLGLNDRRVKFDEAVDGPFGQKVGELTLPEWMGADIASDATPIVVSKDQNGFCFELGDKRFRYDRLGLAKEERDDMSHRHCKHEEV